MVTTAEQLAAARASGEPGRIAEALVGHANTLVEAGELEPARELLDEAAGIHQRAARSVDEARCLVFAATLCRAGGRLDMARERAEQAEAVAPEATAPRVSAATELGEIALLEQAFDRAAACYSRALEQGRVAGLTSFSRAALRRKRAQALAGAQRVEDAIADLEEARALYDEEGHDDQVLRTGVELATALESLGRDRAVTELTGELRARATEAGDDQVLADVELLDAARAVTQGRIDDALAACERARKHALAATVPVAYTTAVMTIAELRESQGDRVAAYEALAVGWATLGDLLGDDVARATFAPKLQAQRERWGDDAFITARDAYYERRRAQLDRA